MALNLTQRTLQRGFLLYSRLTRGMTLGVRAMLVRDGEVLLVKHSYVPGWYFPGGGVEAGESVADALARELREEAGAVLDRPPELFGVYRNVHADRRDHVVLYLAGAFSLTPLKLPNGEIIAAEFFSVDRPPDDASPGTKARLKELTSGSAPAADW